MATVSLDVPEEFVEILGGTPEAAGRELRLIAALLLCHRGEISTGRAVRRAGVSYAEFLEASVRHEVQLFYVDEEDLKAELASVSSAVADIEAIKRDLKRAQSPGG